MLAPDPIRLTTVQYSETDEFPIVGETWNSPKYEDFTFIDWIRESGAKRRDQSASKKWIVLMLMAVLLGYTTAFIDLVSASLHDLKKGLCLSKLEKWSLLSPYLTCPAEDWYDWLELMINRDGKVSNAIINFPIYLFFVLLFVGCAAYIKEKKAPLLRQSGIPEMKLIIAGLNYHLDAFLGGLSFLFKVSALIFVVSSGLWLGKEGPLVHVASCVLSICLKYVCGQKVSEGLKRELLAAATATGIAVAFNALIGGVLFVVELFPTFFIPTKIMWNSFVCATVALVALSGFKVFTDGQDFHEEDLFQVLFGNFNWLFMESIPFIFLGLVGGFFGFIFTKAYVAFSRPAYKHRLWQFLSSTFKVSESKGKYAEILLLALATAVLTYLSPLTRMSLGAFLKLLYTDCPADLSASTNNSTNFICQGSSFSTVLSLAYVVAQGFVLSTYSYSVGLPGGVLMPSLVLGGATGRLVGIISKAIQNGIESENWATCTAKSCIVSPSSYAVVGSAAFFTGITKLSFSVVVIIFELTGAVTYVLPIMVAVMTSKFFNDWLCEENVYDAWLNHEFNVSEYDYIHEVNANKGNGLCEFSSKSVGFKAKLPDVAVSKAMIPLSRTKCLHIFPSEPYSLTGLYAFMSDDSQEGYPLIANEKEPVSLGYVAKRDLYQLLQQTFGNLQSPTALVCLRVKVPENMREKQMEFEESLINVYAELHVVPVDAQDSVIVAKDTTPLVEVIELFEIMHLNYLILMDEINNSYMSGFIDRFILAQELDLAFENINDDLDSIADEFGIHDEDLEDDYRQPRRRHNRVKLIT